MLSVWRHLQCDKWWIFILWLSLTLFCWTVQQKRHIREVALKASKRGGEVEGGTEEGIKCMNDYCSGHVGEITCTVAVLHEAQSFFTRIQRLQCLRTAPVQIRRSQFGFWQCGVKRHCQSKSGGNWQRARAGIGMNRYKEKWVVGEQCSIRWCKGFWKSVCH